MNLEEIKKHYEDLCKKRDATNAKIAPLKVKLAAVNAKVMEAQAEAAELVTQINEARGGAAWLDLKREIGVLAPVHSRITIASRV